MRALSVCTALLLIATASAIAQQAAPAASSAATYTLTVVVEDVNEQDGNIGMLVFNSPKGWAEDRSVALKDITVPAHSGTVTIPVPGLPAGEYAVAVVHDVNKNHKLDRNWLSQPKEQWGLSNNPHALIKTPAYRACTIQLNSDKEIHIKMQQ
ncbi:MAG: DUF2141 domain-containing protein [Candidatus Korobacteraceae bacterium]